MSQSQSELVNDARLPTKLEPERTTHTFLETSHIAGLAGRRARRREREEVWQRQRALEIDTFSTLWLEKCVSDSKGNLRAVREVRRVAPNSLLIDYTRELEAITKLSQQKYDGCFVKSSGWFENDESLFITMEYLPAGDLQRYVVQPFSEPEAQSIALQLLEGLDFMHNNGFSHGDLKPKNIFVLSAGPDWWVKIGDFGISKQVMEGLTGLQSFNGTPAFTAPEVYQQTWQSCETNQEIINTAFAPEIDLWSLGVISYYLLTGKLPFVHQKDLLAYQKNEIELPLGPIGQLLASSEALLFMRAMLAANPSSRLPARDALDHPWLIPLQQDSEPEYEAESRESTHTTHAEEINLSTAQVQTPEMLTQKPRDVLLPGTIGLTTSQQNRPVEDNPPQLPLPFSQSLGFDGDMYKQLVRGQLSGPNTTINDHTTLREGTFITQSQSSESSRPNHTRCITSIDTPSSKADTPPLYTRRGSDAAPIPITELDHDNLPKPESTHSSTRATERLSKRFRRASKDMVPKRSRRSQDSASTRDSALPMSPTSASATSGKKSKSHIVEIPGRPQFAEGLPMFPMRSKKA